MDFLRLEGNLKVSPPMSEGIKDSLHRDAQFFQRRGLIDYSSLVMKINKKKERHRTDEEKIVLRNPLFSIDSTDKDGIFLSYWYY